ncbi:MAG: YhgE/Pip domain-containing protein [Aeromicrobium sp.]|uniref:YhgE/Pip domain-containing protein n=1 Tax=Aeromicrobium sp. TaxID=1871063 RepID=UPI0025BD12D6|nr:YhgE/Pip domain-containing protein [Aeromicrobium sp.]MDF1703227.1 YhgE/Pip domain-containing protein [Aeromicrobium sp.]
MIPSPSLPWFELARLRRSRLARAAVVAVTIVPLLYGALYIWANLDPTGNLDKIRAAVVNEDEIVEVTAPDGTTQPVAIGRVLAADLIGDDDGSNYDWVLTDAKDASDGLASGEYKAVLTIPENLSAAATSTSADPAQAVQGQLDLRTNDRVNYINGTIAERILDAARTALNAQVTETYLDNVYLGFSDIRASLQEAADGAADLAGGARELADGTSSAATGARQLAAGNRELAGGAAQLDGAVGQLAAGLGLLRSQTGTLVQDTQRLADGAGQVAAGTDQVNQTVQTVTQRLLDATSDAAADIDALAAQLTTLADQCEAAGPPEGCALLREAASRSGELTAFVGTVRGQAEQVRADTAALAAGANQVADGNRQLAGAVPTLVSALDQAAGGASTLADSTGRLADGAASAASGADDLAAGVGQLASGADQLAAGSSDLADGLAAGVDQVPDYDEQERQNLASTVATPIEDAADRVNGVANYGTALAPYFMALALWVGAMAIYLLLRPLSDRAIASTAGSARIALAGLAPGLVLSAVQALLLVAVVEGVVGIHAEDRLLLVGTALAAGVVFTAVNQMFIALFGAAGRFLALVVVCLQLTSAGGTYPIETAPGFFNFFHDLLPMTYVVDLFRAATAGGGESVGRDFFALAVFTVLALAVTVVAAYRRQRVTMGRLHPELVV